jgi:hypothetical protein
MLLPRGGIYSAIPAEEREQLPAEEPCFAQDLITSRVFYDVRRFDWPLPSEQLNQVFNYYVQKPLMLYDHSHN